MYGHNHCCAGRFAIESILGVWLGDEVQAPAEEELPRLFVEKWVPETETPAVPNFPQRSDAFALSNAHP